jgi:hypothetical protein
MQPFSPAFADGPSHVCPSNGTAFADHRDCFLWDARDPAAPRWEKAFSPDQGATRETNWTMHFQRAKRN